MGSAKRSGLSRRRVASMRITRRVALRRDEETTRRSRRHASAATAAISDLLFCHSTLQIAWNANFITLPLVHARARARAGALYRYRCTNHRDPSGEARAGNPRRLVLPVANRRPNRRYASRASTVLTDYFQVHLQRVLKHRENFLSNGAVLYLLRAQPEINLA